MSANQLAVTIDDISADNAPAIFVAGGLGRFIDAVKDEVCAEVPDLTTRKGRERIASLSATVSKRKASVEKPGRDYLRHIKSLPKVVEDELREFVNAMNTLRDEVRKPLTDWEAAEQARKDKHVDAIQSIKDFAIFEDATTAERVSYIISIVEMVEINNTWEEFLPEAAQVKDETLAKLRALLAERTQYEAEQAELTRLRLEKEARDKKDNEDRIAREAAEQATREAEAKALSDREAEARRVSDEKAAAEKRESDLRLQAAEAERQAEQAKREKVEAEQKAERDRLQGIEDQKKAVEQARLEEQARADAAADEILRQAAAREADKAHKARINRAALDAFIAGGMTEECAKQAVTLIAQRKIPAIAITY